MTRFGRQTTDGVADPWAFERPHHRNPTFAGNRPTEKGVERDDLKLSLAEVPRQLSYSYRIRRPESFLAFATLAATLRFFSS
jgi:hypothetical protein